MTRNTDGRIPVTQEMRRTLKQWQEKTEYGMTALFRHAEIHGLFKTTKSLSAPAFEGVLRGRTKSVIKEDFETVLKAYTHITPDMYGKPHALSRRKVRVPMSDYFKGRIQAMLDQCSISRAKLLKLRAMPESW